MKEKEKKESRKKDILFGWLKLIIGIVYLLNWGFGVFEIIPDNLPFVGNIDEGVAGGLVVLGFKQIFKKKQGF